MTKPIFTGEFIAFSPFDRQALRSLIRRIEKPFIRIAEIGSWTGSGSTRTIIEELTKKQGYLYCIDHWQGNTNVQRHQQLIAQFDIFATFQANIASYGGAELVKPIVMSSIDASTVIKDHIFDLVFIDGSHTYSETIQDIKGWLPKVTHGGILCGHDCEGRVINLNQNNLWANRNNDTIEGNLSFPRIHPGVILAVDENFDDSVHLWAEDTIELEDGTRGSSTIWDIVVP